MTAPEPLDMAGPEPEADIEDGPTLVPWLLLAALLTVVVVVLVWGRG